MEKIHCLPKVLLQFTKPLFVLFNATQGWKPKLKPKPKNSVLKEIWETQTETGTCFNKFLKT